VRRWLWWFALSVLLGCAEQDGRKNLPTPPPPRISGDQQLQFYPSREELSQVTDDPQSRREYVFLMERDPATGVVPPDIRRLEREHDRRLPRKNPPRRLRTDGTAEAGQWTSAGPYNIGGRTRALALDYTDEDIILAGGVTGGMWRSEDGGQSWTKTTNPGSLHSVTCLAQDIRTGKAGIWYYGTGEIVGNSAAYQGAPFRGDGIFKSADGGKTWNRLAVTAQGSPEAFTNPFQYVHSIATNPFNTNQDEVYAAAVGAIYRSVNGGATWRAVLGPDLLAEPVPDINRIRISQHTEIAIAGNGQFYAALSERGISNSSTLWGIFWSNNGQNWYDITPSGLPRPLARTVIAPSPSNPNILYFLMDSSSPNLWKYEFQRFDGEKVTGRWTNLSDYIPRYGEPVGDFDTQGSYNMVLKVHPADEEVVFMGGTNLYRASDGFASNLVPEWIGGYDTANNIRKYPNHFVDQHALVFYPSNPDKMLSANDGGIFTTENNRAVRVNWSPVNNGYYTSQLFTLSVDEYTASRVVIGGFMDNGVLAVSNPDQRTFWKVLLGGDGAYGAITKYGVYHYTSTQNGRIIRFTLDRNLEYETFARIDPIGGGGKPNQGYLFVNPFVLAPENQNIMYLAGGDKIWRNDNLTQIPIFRNSPTDVNWVPLEETSLNQGRISSLAVSHNPPGILVYGTTVGEVYMVADARAPVVEPDRVGAGVFPSSAYVSCIAVDRLNSDHFIVAFANYNVQSIYSTSDGGTRFEPIGGNLEQFPDGSGSGPSVRWVEIVSLTDGRNRYFAGTSTGLYSTGQLSGANTVWEKESEELIGDALVTMIRYRSDDGRVFAATHGRGIFEARYDDIRRIPLPVEEVQAGLDLPFPNPFETNVTIPFYIPEDGYVRIRMLNTLGQEVKTLMWSLQFAGKNIVTWDGSNVAGTPVTPGIYVVNMEYRNRFYSKLLKYAP
jgi:hypothetical protein